MTQTKIKKNTIHSRKSYQDFRDLYKFITGHFAKRSEPVLLCDLHTFTFRLLNIFHDIVDSRRGYGSETNANYATESLEELFNLTSNNSRSFTEIEEACINWRNTLLEIHDAETEIAGLLGSNWHQEYPGIENFDDIRYLGVLQNILEQAREK